MTINTANKKKREKGTDMINLILFEIMKKCLISLDCYTVSHYAYNFAKIDHAR